MSHEVYQKKMAILKKYIYDFDDQSIEGVKIVTIKDICIYNKQTRFVNPLKPQVMIKDICNYECKDLVQGKLYITIWNFFKLISKEFLTWLMIEYTYENSCKAIMQENIYES